MFRKSKPKITILGKTRQRAETGESQDGENVATPTVTPLIKIQSKERLPMPSPEQVLASQEGVVSSKKFGNKERPGITVEIGSASSEGSFSVTARSQFSVKPAKTHFVVPFTNEYLTGAVEELQRTVQHSGKRAAAAKEEPSEERPVSGSIAVDAFGQKLFDSLFKEELRDMYAEAVQSATAQFPISLLCGDPTVCRLPWEFMHDGQRFVCTNIGPIFRVLPDAPPHAPEMRAAEPLRLLIVASNPLGTPTIGWQQEINNIRQLVQGSKIDVKVAYSIDELTATLLDWYPHVIHFIAHGDDNKIEIGNESGYGVKIGQAWGGLMTALESPPRLILFNACNSGGLAAQLIRSRLPIAVGMQFEISDTAARAFAKGFYRYARTGLPLHKATAWGRLSILTELGDSTFEWATPTLYVNPKTVDLS